MQMFVELMTMYRVPSHEWAGWLVDRLTGKAQGALLNMTLEQQSDWPTLIATLNAHFHVEFEVTAAEEELITRKQGNKESVRDFISNLQALAGGSCAQVTRTWVEHSLALKNLRRRDAARWGYTHHSDLRARSPGGHCSQGVGSASGD
jgi:hypothetical protein